MIRGSEIGDEWWRTSVLASRWIVGIDRQPLLYVAPTAQSALICRRIVYGGMMPVGDAECCYTLRGPAQAAGPRTYCLLYIASTDSAPLSLLHLTVLCLKFHVRAMDVGQRHLPFFSDVLALACLKLCPLTTDL